MAERNKLLLRKKSGILTNSATKHIGPCQLAQWFRHIVLTSKRVRPVTRVIGLELSQEIMQIPVDSLPCLCYVQYILNKR